MNGFNLLAAVATDPIELHGFSTLLASGGLALALWFFRHCRRETLQRVPSRQEL